MPGKTVRMQQKQTQPDRKIPMVRRKGQQTAAVGGNPAKTAAAPLTYDHSMELSYAENFAVDYYEGGYKLLTTRLNGDRILLVPKTSASSKRREALVSPSAEGEPGKLIVLQEPVKTCIWWPPA